MPSSPAATIGSVTSCTLRLCCSPIQPASVGRTTANDAGYSCLAFARRIVYKLLFLVFTFLGSIVTRGNILEFSDMMILGMSFPEPAGRILAQRRRQTCARYILGQVQKRGTRSDGPRQVSRLCVINVVGMTPKLLPHAPRIAAVGTAQPWRSPLPAVTCTSQATMLTGLAPREHGIVGNGW